jgi:iron-sulfur cluster repair protein YtfE (RIC family)
MTEKIDVTMMYAIHNAFRRDLGLFTVRVAQDLSASPHVRAGWKNFKDQLLLHHRVEDSHLFPALHRALADRPPDLASIDEMGAEHAQINPLLSAVDNALTQGTGLADRIADLSTALNKHLEHEEKKALPLIQAVLAPADWKDFTGEMRRQQGVKGAALFVPWLLDSTTPAKQQEYLRMFPVPLRLINGLFWQSRYQKRELWNV